MQLDLVRAAKPSMVRDLEEYLVCLRAVHAAEGRPPPPEKALALQELRGFLQDWGGLLQQFAGCVAGRVEFRGVLEAALRLAVGEVLALSDPSEGGAGAGADAAVGAKTGAGARAGRGRTADFGTQLTAMRALPAVAVLLQASPPGGRGPGFLDFGVQDPEVMPVWRAALRFLGRSPVVSCFYDLAFAPAPLLAAMCRRAGGLPCPPLDPVQVAPRGTLGHEGTGMYDLELPVLRARFGRVVEGLGQLSARRAVAALASSSAPCIPGGAGTAPAPRLPAGLGRDFYRATADALAEALSFLHDIHARLAAAHALRMATDPGSGGLSRPDAAHGTCFAPNLHAVAAALPEEMGALLEAVAMLKNLSALVTRCREWALPALQRSLVDDLQHFFRGILGGARLKGHDALARQLYAFRALAVDFSSQMPAEISGSLGAPSELHLFLIEELGTALLEAGTPRDTGWNVRSKSALDEDAAAELRPLLRRCAAYGPVANLDAHLRRHASLAFLWHRELHFERGASGLPIELSLPWNLSQHTLAHLKHSRPDLILIPFEVFSDAADSILGEGHKQHAFRELQAEVNLAFDQLVFHLADEVFASLKQVASLQCMDKDLQLKLADGLELAGQRLARHAAAQGQVDILGKKIDMKRLLTARFNRLLRENVDYLFERFEPQDARSGLVELDSLLSALRGTHALLAQLFPVDAWARLYREMNEATSLRSFSSRASASVLEEVADEVLPNSLFNCFTRRFVAARRTFHSCQFARAAWPVLPNPGYLYGHKAVNDALREWAKGHAGFLGWNDLAAALRVLGPGEVVALAHHLQKRLIAVVGFSLPDTLEPLTMELKGRLQGLETTVPHEVFSALEEDLGSFRGDSAAHEIMHSFREVGNVLAFLLLLDDCVGTEGVLARAQEGAGAGGGGGGGGGGAGPAFLAEALQLINETLPDEWREAPDDFALAWSALTFIFCLPGGGEETAPALFGDGFLFGGCAVLYLLGCHKDFQSNDPTYLIFSGRHSLAPAGAPGGARAAWLDHAAGALAACDQALRAFAARGAPPDPPPPPRGGGGGGGGDSP